MIALVEVCPGTWVDPRKVTAITVSHVKEDAENRRVWLYVKRGQPLGWNFDNEADAQAWATEVARRINHPLEAPAAINLQEPKP